MHTNKKHARELTLFLVVWLLSVSMVVVQDHSCKLYPYLYDSLPKIASPNVQQDKSETILAVTKKKQYGIVDVTMEDGKPLFYSYKRGTFMGKDKQMFVGTDFPELVKTGRHSIEQLEKKEMITGTLVLGINIQS